MSIGEAKAFEKNQHVFMINESQQTRKKTGRKYLNHWVENICEKPTDSTILHGKKPNAFLQRSRTRQGCPVSQLLFKFFWRPLPVQ